MASPDVDSSFTNIPLDEAIIVFVNNLYSDNENLPNIPKYDFRNLLYIATKESFFKFNNKYYKQTDGVAMVLHWVQPLITFLGVVLKVNGYEIVLINWNQFSIEIMLMTYSHFFLLLIVQINLSSIFQLDIPT